MNAQIFPLGVGADQIQQSWDFEGGVVVEDCDAYPEGTCNCDGTALPAYARDCDGASWIQTMTAFVTTSMNAP